MEKNGIKMGANRVKKAKWGINWGFCEKKGCRVKIGWVKKGGKYGKNGMVGNRVKIGGN